MIADTVADRHVFSDRQQRASDCWLVHHFSTSDTIPKSKTPSNYLNQLPVKIKYPEVIDMRIIKKTSSFKHAAWSKDSILYFWRRHIVCNEHRTSRCQGNVTSLPLPLYRSRSCADVLRGDRADVTDFSRFSWPWWMWSVVKHNMLKITSRSHPHDLLYGETVRDMLILRVHIKHSRNS